MNTIFKWLLITTPAAIAANFLGYSDTVIFFLAALAIVPLAKFLGDATEEVAGRSGPALGGLVNATFGNATELIIGILALNAGLIEVVKASITGSIVGNLLLVLGASFFVGGLKHKSQKFNRTASLASSSTLFLAVIALAIPVIFRITGHVNSSSSHDLSTLVAAFMFAIYIAQLVFTFFTHRHLYIEEIGKLESRWTIKQAVAVLAVTTIFIAWLSEILVNAIKPTLVHLGWTELFVGAVVIAIIGNAAEHASAVTMAAKNRMDLALQITIGSATQIALFVVPFLVFTGLVINQPMDLIFTTFELATIVVSVMIANLVVQDGESNWLEGAQLLAAYGIIAVAFFLYPA